MKVVRALVTLIVASVAVGGVALYVVLNHSTVERQLICKGKWKGDPPKEETAYVRLTEYRPWVLLWSSSHGNLTAQTHAHPYSAYISDIRKINHGTLAIYSFRDFPRSDDHPGPIRGGYRAASQEILIEFAPALVFVGSCEPDARY
jgi:hypothetical protein